MLGRIAIDKPVLMFAIGIAVLAAFVSGVWPALRASQANPNEALKAGGRSGSGYGGGRLRSALVVTEFALAIILLVGILLTRLSSNERN